LVAQLEVPIETIEFAAGLANKSNVPFILDPAPAQELSDQFLKMVDVLTPNETEAQILTGIEVKDSDSANAAAQKLLECGVKNIILTMGASGYLTASNEGTEFVEARKVTAVDSTAAGDAFTGSLAVGLARGQSLSEAALFANNVAAVSVTKMGAQPSMPTVQEVEAFISKTEQ
jgi:ribokinase